VALAGRRMTFGLRPYDLLVTLAAWKLLDFLDASAACGLLGLLVVLDALAVIFPSRIWSPSRRATSLGALLLLLERL
jgi:hypothetical protein